MYIFVPRRFHTVSLRASLTYCELLVHHRVKLIDLFQINVEDINDHKPVFEETAYTTEVRESVSVGSTVITVRASDKDAGKNGEILYSIKTQSSKPDVFRIDPKTGVISTRLPLDREKEASHSLVIEATDQVYIL